MEKTLGIWCGAKSIAVFCKYGGKKYENNFKKRVFKASLIKSRLVKPKKNVSSIVTVFFRMYAIGK